MKNSHWEILDSQYIIANKWIRLRRDRCKTPKGKIIDEYYVNEGNSAALIFWLTADKKVPILKQYRHGVQRMTYCLPGGKVEDNEVPKETIERELLEETGYVVNRLNGIGRLAKSPANSDGHVHIFIAALGEKVSKP